MNNVGTFDKRVRVLVGLGLFGWALLNEGALRWGLIGAAIVLILTAYYGYCPVWHGFRINTHRPPKV